MNMPQFPTARREDLVIQEVSDEILIYDLKNNKAHCLNQTAAFIWKACDGNNSVAQLAQDIEKNIGDKVSEDFIWLAIDQLNEKNLLADDIAPKFAGQNRRQVLKKIGLASVIALPIVASLTAPKAAMAVACSSTVASASCPQCPGAPCTGGGCTGAGCTCQGGTCQNPPPRGGFSVKEKMN